MKNLSTSIALLIVILFSAISIGMPGLLNAQCPGVIPNASFENGNFTGGSPFNFAGGIARNMSSRTPTGWSKATGIGDNYWVQSTAARTGSKYLYMYSSGTTVGGNDACSQVSVTGLQGNTCYTLCVYAADAKADGLGSGFSFEVQENNGASFHYSNILVQDNPAWLNNALTTIPWRQYCYTFTTQPNTTAATLWLSASSEQVQGSDTSYVVIDDACMIVCTDYGDLRDSTSGTGTGDYQTLQVNNGACHTIVSGLKIGATVDAETDGQPSALADGDGADEDGIATFPTFTAGSTANITVRVMNMMSPGAAATLYGFIDWNNDGDFLDANESATTPVINGTNGNIVLPINVPSGAVTGANLGARFRLSTQTGLTALGCATNGEVEDYLVSVTCSCTPSVPIINMLKHPGGVGPNDNGRFFYNTSGTTVYKPVVCGTNDVIETDPCDPWTLEFYASMKDGNDCVYFDSASINWDTVTCMDFDYDFVYPVGYVAGNSADSILIKFTITSKPSDSCSSYWPYVCPNGDTINILCWEEQCTNQILKIYGRDACPNTVVCTLDWSNNVLPVELESFTSGINGNNVTLNWATASELNNSGFDIERKNSGTENWEKIGYVTGNGNSNISNNYNYTDQNLTSGKYNYRLKQIDYNGNFEYFNLNSEVGIGNPTKFDLSQNYPNPFNPSTTINFDLPADGFVTLKIYNTSGKEVASLVNETRSAGYHTVSFNAANLSSGVYYYRLESNGISKVMKMALIK